MNRLVNKGFWDARHESHVQEIAEIAGRKRGVIQRWFDSARISIGAQPSDSYPEFLVGRVYRNYLPQRKDWSIIEIGSAPGRNLVEFHRTFGYEPFGVEYSPVGAEETRTTLAEHGHNPDNVIETDFFDRGFQDEHKERFNVALSRGFIEHFDDPANVVKAHVNLLAKDGYLVCTVPNLLSYAYPFLRVFGKDLLDAHNCTIMRLDPYRRLFDDTGLQTVFCGYVGVCQFFGVTLRHEASFRGRVARVMDRTGDVLNHMMFLGLRGRAIETRWSPQLVYIGRKIA